MRSKLTNVETPIKASIKFNDVKLRPNYIRNINFILQIKNKTWEKHPVSFDGTQIEWK